MGSRAAPIVAFGFNIGAEEEIDNSGFPALADAARDLKTEGWPVKLVEHGHHEYPYWFLSISGTCSNAGDWGDALAVPTEVPDVDRITAARRWCAANKIEWTQPGWCALAAFR